MVMKKMNKTSSTSKKIKVIDKYGKHSAFVTRQKAEHSVKNERAIWVDAYAIQVLYHYSDEKAFKKEVLKRDEYQCQYCGIQMHIGHKLLTIDHVTPRRLGGSILPKNMVCSCRICNEQKGHRTYKEYFLHLYALVYWYSLSYNALEGKGAHEKIKTTQPY